MVKLTKDKMNLYKTALAVLESKVPTSKFMVEKPKEDDSLIEQKFLATYKNRKLRVESKTMAGAKKTAMRYFKLKPRDAGDVSVKILREDSSLSEEKGKYPYIAHFMGKKHELWADNLWDAKQKAINHFRPSKKNMGLLAVNLADTRGPTSAQFESVNEGKMKSHAMDIEDLANEAHDSGAKTPDQIISYVRKKMFLGASDLQYLKDYIRRQNESVDENTTGDVKRMTDKQLQQFLDRYDSDEPGMAPAFGNAVRRARDELLRRKRMKTTKKAVDKLTKEDVEQVDELSNSKTKSYLHRSMGDHSHQEAISRYGKTDAEKKAALEKMRRRNKGMGMALNKLANRNESIEQVDDLSEISANAAERYKNAAHDDMNKKRRDTSRAIDRAIISKNPIDKDHYYATRDKNLEKIHRRQKGIKMADRAIERDKERDKRPVRRFKKAMSDTGSYLKDFAKDTYGINFKGLIGKE